MMKSRIDEELDRLDLGTMALFSLVEEALVIITSTVFQGRGKERIEDLSAEIGEKGKALEGQATNILLRFHPVARDLRHISSTLSTIRDLLRIGDNALDFFEMAEYVEDTTLLDEVGLMEMAVEVKKMLSFSMSAFLSQNEEKAREAEGYDDVIDGHFSSIRKKLVSFIREGREGADEATDLVIGAKYLERMGDHAASIAHSVLVESGKVEENVREG